MIFLILIGGIFVVGTVFVLQSCLRAAAQADEQMDRLMNDAR